MLGAISQIAARSTPSSHTEHWQKTRYALSTISDALSVAKQHLGTSELESFETWLARVSPNRKGGPGVGGQPLHLIESLPRELSARTLGYELKRARLTCQNHHAFLKHFVEDFGSACSIIQRQDWAGLEEATKQSIAKLGFSFWHLEMLHAAVQLGKGIEEQKRLNTTLQSGAQGVARFMIYAIGTRNEPAQTSHRFVELMKLRLSASEVKPGNAVFLSYKLWGGLPENVNDLAYLVAGEQFTTAIDLLITSHFISTLVIASGNLASKDARDEAELFLFTFQEFTFAFFGMAATKDSATSGALTPSRLSQEIVQALESQLKSLASRSLDLLLGPNQTQGISDSTGGLEDHVVSGIASKLDTRTDGVASEALAKLQLNLHSYPLLRTIGAVSNIQTLTTTCNNVLRRGAPSRGLACNIQHKIEDSFLSPEQFTRLSPLASERLKLLSRAIAAKGATEIASAAQALAIIPSDSAHDAYFDARLTLRSVCLCQNEDFAAALPEIVLVGLECERVLSDLPFEAILEGKKWKDVKHLGDTMFLSVCIELYSRVCEESRVRQLKRHAVERLLQIFKAKTLAELGAMLLKESADPLLIEFFLLEVCDTTTIELLPGVGSSRNVRVAKRDIYRFLATCIPGRHADFVSLATEIEAVLELGEQMRLIDDSRVYVDEPRLLNILNRQIGSDFERFRGLIAAGIVPEESFTDVMQQIVSAPNKTLEVPKNDADDLWYSMFNTIREKFLLDPAYGLDIHLSRRIRHGTISSELRGPLERAGLIGHRPLAKKHYVAPQKVIELTNRVDSSLKEPITQAFSKFSEAIDALINELKNEYFQVRSKERPNGLFELQTTPLLVRLCRSLTGSSENLVDFAQGCFAIFWSVMFIGGNQRAKQFELHIRRQLSQIFARLFRELKILPQGEERFLAELQHVAEDLNSRSSTIGSWAQQPRFDQGEQGFTLEKCIEASIGVIKMQQPHFSPIVTQTIDCDVLLDTYGYLLVLDALYIAWANIYEHSGKKNENHVNIGLRFDQANSVIHFEISNEVDPQVVTPERASQIQELLLDLKSNQVHENVRKESGSGLPKLGALVLQSPNTYIDFGFNGTDHFNLKFSLEYIG